MYVLSTIFPCLDLVFLCCLISSLFSSCIHLVHLWCSIYSLAFPQLLCLVSVIEGGGFHYFSNMDLLKTLFILLSASFILLQAHFPSNQWKKTGPKKQENEMDWRFTLLHPARWSSSGVICGIVWLKPASCCCLSALGHGATSRVLGFYPHPTIRWSCPALHRVSSLFHLLWALPALLHLLSPTS